MLAFLARLKPFADLPSSPCPAVAAYAAGVMDRGNASAAMTAKLKAQALATALDVYFSDPALGGDRLAAPAPIGDLAVT